MPAIAALGALLQKATKDGLEFELRGELATVFQGHRVASIVAMEA